MPIYEYSCNACRNSFEILVLTNTALECPSCASRDLERLISSPSVHSEGTHRMAMRAAKKRDRALATDRAIEQRKYEESHDRHG